jgi:hypothetical protein
VNELVPPTLAIPLANQWSMRAFFFIYNVEPKEVEYVEKDIIVDGIDR